jgi:hypothetical protein
VHTPDQERREEVGAGSAKTGEIDPIRLESYLRELRDNQNLGVGLLAGAAAATVGAGIWAAVTVITNYQIGWMAVGVGFLVGYAVRVFGKGLDLPFRIMGAVLSLLGCLAGNLLTVCVLVARQQDLSLGAVLSGLDPGTAIQFLKVTFSPMDLLFYGIAVYEGYQFSIRRLTSEEIAHLARA